MRFYRAVLVALAIIILSACAPVADESKAKNETSEPAEPEPEPAAESIVDEPEERIIGPVEPPPPEPDPELTYTDSCDYVLGDFTSYTASGYRFVADAQLRNVGNVGVINQVVAIWFLSGGGKIVMEKMVRLAAGERTRVGFTRQVGGDEIDLHQALGYDTTTCKVVVRMIETFGKPSY